MRIAITGTPGTGKTEVSKELADLLDYEYVDLNERAEEEGLVMEEDLEREAKVIDVDRLDELDLPEDCVIDGHLSHFLDADLCVVLRTEPEELRERLEERGWEEEKIEENLEAEILGVISVEARRHGEEAMDVDTGSFTRHETAELIRRRIERGETSSRPIDWTRESYEP